MAELTREEVERIVKKSPGGRSELPRLNKRDLSHLNLSNIDFNWANLSGANLSETNLSKANLTGVDCIGADLSGADLKGANLTGARLGGAKLVRVDLSGADLTMANLLGAILIEAKLSGANLFKVDLGLSTLVGANLTAANLTWTDLTGSLLDGADLSDAQVSGTRFGDIDLREVQGLDTVKHVGPSYIDTHTLIRSQGKIPESFLRDCGLSDLQIEMAKLHNPDLTSEQVEAITYKIHEFHIGHLVQYHSCFISYSSQDQAFAQRLYIDLKQKGVRCWFALEDMKIGDEIRQTIDRAIRMRDKLLVILSENSMQSDWVEDEVETAIEVEKKRGKTVLFPIQLDEAVMDTDQAWAAKLRRSRHIGNFSRWKDHDAYQQAFKRLLRDLKAEG